MVGWQDEAGEQHKESFECVLLAQGHHAKPKKAQFPGQENFQGRIIHSHDYKESRDFEDKASANWSKLNIANDAR